MPHVYRELEGLNERNKNASIPISERQSSSPLKFIKKVDPVGGATGQKYLNHRSNINKNKKTKNKPGLRAEKL